MLTLKMESFRHKSFFYIKLNRVENSVADPEHFDADPTFQANEDPDPQTYLSYGEKKFFLPKFLFLLHNLTKLVMCNFFSGGMR